MNVVKKLADLPGALTQPHLDQFDRQGYLAYANLLSEAEVDELKEAMRELCLEMVRGVETGRCQVTRNHKGDSFAYYVIEKNGPAEVHFEAGIDIQGLPEEELSSSYRKLWHYIDSKEPFARVKTHPRLTPVLDHLLGPGSILFQDMALSKPARIGTEKPWHQDLAYFQYVPLEAILGVWIALDDATVENGCMQVIPTPKSQLTPYKHTNVIDCDLNRQDLDLERAEAVEIPAGGVMFFSGLLPHHTPPNRSDQGRRALQLHFRGAQTSRLSPSDYAKVFKTADGLPAACKTS